MDEQIATAGNDSAFSTPDIRIDAEGTLTGYSAFVKKEDLLVYERIVFTVKEEGQPCILQHFDDRLAGNNSWTAVKIPQDSLCTIRFNGLDVRGTLAQVSATRKFDEEGASITYRFVLERQMLLETVNQLIHPYFKARTEQTVEKPKTQWSKGGEKIEMVPCIYPITLTI